MFRGISMAENRSASDGFGTPHGQGGRSHLVAGTSFTGDLTVSGALELHGHADGRISADILVIEMAGVVLGEIHARRIDIKGRFDGAIFGGDVRLLSSAHVSGTINSTTLTIESGAEVNATFSHSQEATPSLSIPAFSRKSRAEQGSQPDTDDNH